MKVLGLKFLSGSRILVSLCTPLHHPLGLYLLPLGNEILRDSPGLTDAPVQCSQGPLSDLWEHVWQQCLRLPFSGGPWEDPLLPFLGPGYREGVLTPSLPATRLFLVTQGQPGSEQARQSPAQAAFTQQKGINLLLPCSRGFLLPPFSLGALSKVLYDEENRLCLSGWHCYH